MSYPDDAIGYRLFSAGPNPVSEISVRKARIGWWVDGRWCPTRKVRDFEIPRALRRTIPKGKR